MIADLRRFLRSERAAVAMETVLITPLLVWAYMMSFAFFDAYRVYNTTVKTTYMVADMLSRQTNDVYVHDIEGMANIAASIIRGGSQLQMRASQISMVDGSYEVDWSRGVKGAADLFDANIPDIEDMLPTMPDGESIVLVEMFVNYEAPLDIGLTVAQFDSFTVVRPRYAGQVSCCLPGLPPST
ncbi:MAG: TadE/TadG family type IV pilus assembly protein [Roseicyclus sp.]